jgi:hypothetical protein
MPMPRVARSQAASLKYPVAEKTGRKRLGPEFPAVRPYRTASRSPSDEYFYVLVPKYVSTPTRASRLPKELATSERQTCQLRSFGSSAIRVVNLS